MGQITFDEFVSRVESNQTGIAFQLVIGRGGSLFLHSLLDNHPEILAYPGMLNFYESMAQRIEAGGDSKTVIAEELTFWNEIMLPYNITHQLGADKNTVINIDAKQVAEETIKTAGSRIPERKYLFLALNYSLALFLKKDLDAVRLIYCQEHTSYPSEKIFSAALNDFPRAKFLCMVRDPRANYLSIKGWEEKRYHMNVKAWEVQKYQPGLFADLCIYWYASMLKLAEKYSSNFYFIRLEDVQSARTAYLQMLAKLLGIRYSDTMQETTFSGATWHGDNFAPKQQGFRTSANPSKWKSELSGMKQEIIDVILQKEIQALGYPSAEKGFFHKLTAWILFPFWLWDDLAKIFLPEFYRFEKTKGHSLAGSFFFTLRFHIKSTFALLKFIFSKSRIYTHVQHTILSVK